MTAGQTPNTEEPTSVEHAPAGVPSEPAHTSPARQGGPLVPFSQPAPTVPNGERRERTVHDGGSRTAKSAYPVKTVLTANPNRTKAPARAKTPTRQEVDR